MEVFNHKRFALYLQYYISPNSCVSIRYGYIFCWLGFLQSVERGVIRVNIGTPVFIIDKFNVTIDCNTNTETPPKLFSWFHNNKPDQYRGNESSITIAVPNAADINGDNYTCKVENHDGSVYSSTTTFFAPRQSNFCIP